MYGIGAAELVIIGLIFLMAFVPGIIGIGVLVWYVMKNKKKSSSQENEP